MSDLFGNSPLSPGMAFVSLPPGVKVRNGMPYAYVTWLTPILGGDDQCVRQPWMKAHYKFDSAQKGGVPAEWKTAHGEMVGTIRDDIERAGYRLTVEDQNKFTLKGTTILIGGKPDLIAYKENLVRVVDAKTGEEKGAHWWQVWIYLYALPRVAGVTPENLQGELHYKNRTVIIAPTEITPENIARVTKVCRQVSAAERPPAVPSPRECAFCDVPKSLCPERDDSGEGMTGTTEDF